MSQTSNVDKLSVHNSLSADEYVRIRDNVGWGAPSYVEAQRALDRSLTVFSVRISGEAVGSVRIVGDDSLCFYIQDLMVLCEHGGKGIARALMQAAMQYISHHASNNAFIGLMAAKGLHEFYSSFGFIERPNNTMGPGMIQYYGRNGQVTEI